jgi:signal transduction histidine kinase
VPRLGLRGRVAIALVLTAALALTVAALALLSPLERRLRTAEVRDLVTAAVQSRASFAELNDPVGKLDRARLRDRVRHLATETGARVALLDAKHRVLYNTDPDEPDSFRDAFAALHTDRAVRRIVTLNSTPMARVAARVIADGHTYVLALRKPLTEQISAVAEVRRAFGTAALVALGVALLTTLAFAATVGRRLRALRNAVMRFHVGGDAGQLPQDRATDEVGDLSRAFRAMAVRLGHEEDVRREFVSTASHELRTPLMSLQGRLELLADELDRARPDLDDGRRQLAAARDQADRLGRLASDLLDLSRLDTGETMRREPVEMAELVRAVAAEFGARADAQHTPIELDLRPARAAGDPGACARVVRILLDNALRYSADGAPIEVELRASDGQVELDVRDHGPGVPEADRARIFDRFARGSSANPEGGFGLGLAIGRELSELMEGGLDVQPGNGSGATFRLCLPAAPGDR